MVAFSSAGFLSSMMTRGQAVDEQNHVRPAGVLVLCHGELVDHQPVVVVWLSEIDHLACAPAMEPSGRRYSTGTPSTSMRWKARLRVSSVGPSGRLSLRKASSSASAGSVGFNREGHAEPLFQSDLAESRPLG